MIFCRPVFDTYLLNFHLSHPGIFGCHLCRFEYYPAVIELRSAEKKFGLACLKFLLFLIW